MVRQIELPTSYSHHDAHRGRISSLSVPDEELRKPQSTCPLPTQSGHATRQELGTVTEETDHGENLRIVDAS